MTYRCPICLIDFDSAAILQPSGVSGPSYRPNCQGRVRVILPYGKYAAIIALLLAWTVLAFMHVRSLFGIVFGTVLIWIPLSLFLNAITFRYKAPILKKWEPRKERKGRHYRSLFEWLYERDKPPDMFNKKDD